MSRITNFFKGIFSRPTKKEEMTPGESQPSIRSILMEYYGGNVGWFAYSYASSMYNIPSVRTAIQTFAEIFSTIPRYIERVDKEGHIEYFETAESRVINMRANHLQNATQFWVNLITALMLHSNVFVEPVFGQKSGKLEQLYVLPNDQFDFTLYQNRATVTFLRIGKTYDMKDLIYLNRFSALGGGQKNDLGLFETVIQALMEQAIAAADPNKPKAFIQAETGRQSQVRDEDKKGVMAGVGKNMEEQKKGLFYLDPQWKITPINWTENDVNRDLMQFIVNIVYNYFGITESIINNKATEIEYQLFVKNHIEPIARQVEQEFTNKIFTDREIEFGNRIELDTFSLSVSTLAAKTAFFNVAGRGGIANEDEQREMIGLPPIPGGLGKIYRVTADTINLEKFDEYQLSKNGVSEKSAAAEEPNGAEGAAASKGGNK